VRERRLPKAIQPKMKNHKKKESQPEGNINDTLKEGSTTNTYLDRSEGLTQQKRSMKNKRIENLEKKN
jgi:hypothetical protein